MKVSACFAICYSTLSIVWSMGWLRRQLNQIIVVVTIFTFLFFNVSSLTGLKCKFWNHLSWFNSLYLTVKINNLLFVRIVMGFGAMEVYNVYSKRSSSSFTPSELSIVVSASFTFLSVSLSCVLNNYIGLDYPFCTDDKPLLVLHSIFLGCLFMLTNIYLIRVYIGRDYHLFIYCTLMYGIVGTYLILVKTSSSEPIYWLHSYLTKTQERVGFKWYIIGGNLIQIIFRNICCWYGQLFFSPLSSSHIYSRGNRRKKHRAWFAKCFILR